MIGRMPDGMARVNTINEDGSMDTYRVWKRDQFFIDTIPLSGIVQLTTLRSEKTIMLEIADIEFILKHGNEIIEEIRANLKEESAINEGLKEDLKNRSYWSIWDHQICGYYVIGANSESKYQAMETFKTHLLKQGDTLWRFKNIQVGEVNKVLEYNYDVSIKEHQKLPKDELTISHYSRVE